MDATNVASKRFAPSNRLDPPRLHRNGMALFHEEMGRIAKFSTASKLHNPKLRKNVATATGKMCRWYRNHARFHSTQELELFPVAAAIDSVVACTVLSSPLRDP